MVSGQSRFYAKQPLDVTHIGWLFQIRKASIDLGTEAAADAKRPMSRKRRQSENARMICLAKARGFLYNKDNVSVKGDIHMACLLVPVAEAVVTTIAAKVMRSKEKAPKEIRLSDENGAEVVQKLPFSRKLTWLSHLLWGGSALLAFEHVWHGEIVPWFPFLTAAVDQAERAAMLHEMATVGVSMTVLVTLVWCGMLAVSAAMEKRALKPQPETK